MPMINLGRVKGEKGDPGKDGTRQIAFEIINGRLIMTYETGSNEAQNFSINDNGHLIYTFN